ncbi:uncharacterized protein LOC103179809 isoform X2 [Callorhinchus milii]|nr:uncharacterized protein LOC103179809 isoform X2 [Callorhinchus milii]
MREKKKKQKTGKRNSAVVSGILQKFLNTYKRNCAQSLCTTSPKLRQDLRRCIEKGAILTKLIVARPEVSEDDSLPVSLKPLLMTIREERYMHGKELCVWDVPLTNQDIAELAIIIELHGRTSYPFSKVELMDCGIDAWSVERFGKAVNFSVLICIVLDYNEIAIDGLRGLCHGLEGNTRLLTLSMCYCNLGPASGPLLGNLVTKTAIRDVFLDGNDLQCEGASKLIEPIAQQAGTEAQSKVNKGKRSRKELPEVASWVSKLHLADNGIDGRGKDGNIAPMQFTQMVCQLIRFSNHLTELDLDDNCLGELCGKELLNALKERKEAKMPSLKIKVTAQMNADTFSKIVKCNRKLKKVKKKKKRKK